MGEWLTDCKAMRWLPPLLRAWVVMAALVAIAPADLALAQLRPPLSPPGPDAPSQEPPAPTVVELDLVELINIVVQGNRELKNAVLERIVQRQALEEAESRFDPQVTPTVSVQLRQDLGDDPDLGEGGVGDRTTTTERLAATLALDTILGTEIRLTADPLDENERVSVSITQPLLQGAGRTINAAPVNQARITETRNRLDLQQQLIRTVTRSITLYTTLIQRQETVRIQEQALERRQQQFAIINALVEAGRRARVDLIDAERSLAEAERDLQDSRNQLSQTNTELLNLIGTDARLRFVVPPDLFSQLFAASIRRVPEFQLEQLVERAYQNRPDYQQARLDVEFEQLGLLVARDDRRWSLDFESNAVLGEASAVTAALQLTRTFGDERLQTAVERSQVNVLQRQNTLVQLTETIQNDILTQLGNVNSSLAEIAAAQQATEAAQLQLQATQERFRRGIGEITLFNVIQSEENLVNAQNAELQARIRFLERIAELDQSVGITLTLWQPWVDFRPVLSPE